MHSDAPTPPRAASPSALSSGRLRSGRAANVPGIAASTPAAYSQAVEYAPGFQAVETAPMTPQTMPMISAPPVVEYVAPQQTVIESMPPPPASARPAMPVPVVAPSTQRYEMVSPITEAPQVFMDHDQKLPAYQTMTVKTPATAAVYDYSSAIPTITQTPPELNAAYTAQLVQNTSLNRVKGGAYAEALESGMVQLAPTVRLPVMQEVSTAQITTAPEMKATSPYVAESQMAPGTTQTFQETRQGEPIAPIYLPPEPAQPIILPMQQYWDRLRPYPAFPVPVYHPHPHPVFQPTPVTHTFKQYAPHYDHDFPYHDPAFGSGWRFHYPDNLDEAMLNMGTYKPTPLEEMRHAAYESQMKDEWINAHVAESQYGVRHRHLPFSRRVRLPERLIPDPEDYSEIIL